MSNRLEEEFPHTSWRVVPPVGPRGQERDIVRRYVARGRKLRSEAVREALRGTLARMVVVLAMSGRGVIVLARSLRGAGDRLARPRREPGCLADSARGA